MQVLKIVNIREDAAAGRVVLQVVEHPIHLIHVPLGVVVLYGELVAVGLADGAVFVGPAVPNVATEVVNIIGLLLPDPQKLVDTGFEIGAAEGQNGELLLQIIAVYKAELFHRVGGGAVLPVGAHGQVGIPNAVFQNVAAVGLKNLVGTAHRQALLFISRFPARPPRAWR